jgi:hypothetical protein
MCQRAARQVERSAFWKLAGMPRAVPIAQDDPAAKRERERMVSMRTYSRRRWAATLIIGLMACGLFGTAPAQAQSAPIVVPPIASIVAGIPPGTPSLVVGFPGDSGVNSRAGLTWSTTGRADVDIDVDINRQHGQAAAG